MYSCVDIGGTKTLVAQVDVKNNIVKQQRFETPRDYKQLIKMLSEELASYPTNNTTVIGAPGLINRSQGRVLTFGNLPWKDVQLKSDIEAATKKHRVWVENDANLGALGEYVALGTALHQILYITISTGLGTGIITGGVIDPEHIDSEGGKMLIEFQGRLTTWEKISSGKSIVDSYHKTASELNDPKAWKEISHWLAIGIINLLTTISPDKIIIGGGVGTHFEKYKNQLQTALDKLKPAMINLPPIAQARHPETAVIIGAAELSRQLAASR